LNKPDVDANTTLRNWAIVPALYLLSYVVFELGRSVISEWWLRTISWSVLLGTLLFTLPMAMMAAIEAKWSAFELFLGVLSARGIPFVAMLPLLPIIIGIGSSVYDKWRQ